MRIVLGLVVLLGATLAAPSLEAGDDAVRQAAEMQWQQLRARNNVPDSMGIVVKGVAPDRQPGRPAGHAVRFEQTFHGIPVKGATGVVVLTASGELDHWAADRIYTNEFNVDPDPTISSERASSIALMALGEKDASPNGVKLVVFPSGLAMPNGTTLDEDLLVWAVALLGTHSHGFYIDAHSGAILHQEQPRECAIPAKKK